MCSCERALSARCFSGGPMRKEKSDRTIFGIQEEEEVEEEEDEEQDEEDVFRVSWCSCEKYFCVSGDNSKQFCSALIATLLNPTLV